VAPTLAACDGDGEQLQLRGATGRARAEVDGRRSWRRGTEAPAAVQGSGGRREAVGGGGIWTVVGPRGASRFRRIWGNRVPTGKSRELYHPLLRRIFPEKSMASRWRGGVFPDTCVGSLSGLWIHKV
jgi:hypothetical protein